MRAFTGAIQVIILSSFLSVVPVWAQEQPATEASGQGQEAAQADSGWPRQFAHEGNTVTLYQPQVESWEGNQLKARIAVSVQTAAAAQPTFGVIWVAARTEVDKEKVLVTLEAIKIAKTDFPKESGDGSSYAEIVNQSVPLASRTVSLARLESSLAVTKAEQKQEAVNVPLKNDPPKILFSTSPGILVLIDGKPVLRQVEGTGLVRVINTRALILFDESSGRYYLRLMGQWMEATGSIEGPWAAAQNPPASLDKAKEAVSASKQVDMLEKPEGEQASDTSSVPTVYVSTTPAELIQTQGQPGFAPIDGTQLLVVKNTSDHIFLDISSQTYYVLISGRWFRAKTMNGQWEYVPASKLPADFAKIPENHPKGDALISVAGTPQAKEAVIANSIPQTASVNRNEAQLTVQYDGKPEFRSIEGTKLHYAANTPTPVIQVNKDTYCAVENGVWFMSNSPTGPWVAASSVPGEIYTIPPSSPLHYVTFVHVYGSTPEVIYVGYQPGYLGTCVSEEQVVVYGTGYVYPDWIGEVWYGPPVTYGFGAGFAAGFGTGFALGFAAGHWWHPWWGPYWGWHDWHGNVYINHTNIYNHWGRNVINHGGRPIIHPVTSGRTVHGDVYAGRDGKAYRREDGNWHRYEGKDGWKPVKADGEKRAEGLEERGRDEKPLGELRPSSESPGRLDREEGARSRGEFRDMSSRSEGFGGGGGFHGGGGGFHGGGGFRRR
jgi:uncharacterized membrane protein YgcG